MSDEIDRANEYQDHITDRSIKYIRQKSDLKKGVPGDCDLCGEHSMRLVDGVCAPCRDRYKLK
jgi:hypothetical protein